MAKKNSTKTATKEAMQASEPKVQVFQKWQGINISESPENWDSYVDNNSQTELAPNFLLVQNNVDTTLTQCLETRKKDSKLFIPPTSIELIGVSYMKGRMLYVVGKEKGSYETYSILRHDVMNPDPTQYDVIPVSFDKHVSTKQGVKYTHITSYLNNEVEYLIVLGTDVATGECNTFTGELSTILTNGVKNAVKVSDPATRPAYIAHNIMAYSNAKDFWETVLKYSSTIKASDGSSVSTSSIANDVYGGYFDQRTSLFWEDMVEAGKWYINQFGSMYSSTLRQWFDYTTNASDLNIAVASYWKRFLTKDKMTFDRAWVYKRYNSNAKVPSSVVSPNEWRVDPTHINLTQPTTLSKWAQSPTQLGSIMSVTDPDANYQNAWQLLAGSAPSSISSEFTRWGVASNGDLWVAVSMKRGSTGYDLYLFQANQFEIDSIDPEAPGVTDINVMYAFANRFGQTTLSTGENILSFSPKVGPVNWTTSSYVTIGIAGVPRGQDIERINLYFTMDESTSPTFMGSIQVNDDGASDIYTYDWYGAMTDTNEWSTANMKPDANNTTRGPDARFCHMHDGRLYFWGSIEKPYRLIIGGNAGHELNISRGYGGAYLDIEPGMGTVIHGTYKWKTASCASIVTVLCGNENTSQHKRFNIVENNITVNTELAEKSYMAEEVSNTVGCQSDWGAGVWMDGFYVLNRYGLTVTTMAMEYNSQMQSQVISDAVQPIFTDNLATIMENARMMFVDGTIYICFGTEGDPDQLDRVILCYDMELKAWYTYTYGDENTDVRHITNIDYKGQIEGIGIICADHVGFIPTTGTQDYVNPHKIPFILETGEISANKPSTIPSYLAQLEFRFDWFIGDMDIDVEGVDYYGRRVHVHKHIHTDEVVNDFADWIRVNLLLENYHIVMKGEAMFKLTHIISKLYRQSNKIVLQRGYDSLQTYRNRHGGTNKVHHYIRNYANLRETILP